MTGRNTDKLTDSNVGESIQRSCLGCGGNSCWELFTSFNGLTDRERERERVRERERERERE